MKRALTTALLIAVAASASPEEKAAKTIVFVCEHGTVKSVIAMQLFNKLETDQGSRLGAVPRPVAEALSTDGLNRVRFRPDA